MNCPYRLVIWSSGEDAQRALPGAREARDTAEVQTSVANTAG